MKITLPADRAVDAEVDLGMTDGDYLLRARLNVSLPGLEVEVAQSLVDAATSSAHIPRQPVATSTW